MTKKATYDEDDIVVITLPDKEKAAPPIHDDDIVVITLPEGHAPAKRQGPLSRALASAAQVWREAFGPARR